MFLKKCSYSAPCTFYILNMTKDIIYFQLKDSYPNHVRMNNLFIVNEFFRMIYSSMNCKIFAQRYIASPISKQYWIFIQKFIKNLTNNWCCSFYNRNIYYGFSPFKPLTQIPNTQILKVFASFPWPYVGLRAHKDQLQ